MCACVCAYAHTCVCACDGENMEVFYRQKCVSLNDHLRVREETSILLPMLLHVSVSLT